jgi:cytochrome c oxidase cbb3-type subunit IV
MDYAVWSSVLTVVMLVAFVGIVAWAWSSRRAAAFEAAARVPLEEEDAPPPRKE